MWRIETEEGLVFGEYTEYQPEVLEYMSSQDIPIDAFNYAKSSIILDDLHISSLTFDSSRYYIGADQIANLELRTNGPHVNGSPLYPIVDRAEPPAVQKYSLDDVHPEVVALIGAYKGIGELLLHLEPTDFSSKWTTRLYNLVRTFYNRYASLPTIDELRTIVGSRLSTLPPEDRAELESLTDLVGEVSSWDIRDEVFRDIAGKYLRDVRIQQALLKISADTSDLPSVISTLTAAAKFELSAQDMVTWSDLSRLENAAQIIRKVPLGWSTFDEMTQGGILRPSLMVVVGKPYSGKTQVMLNMAQNLVNNGYRVLYFSMELSGKMLMLRQDASRLGQHYQTLYTDENISSTREALKAQMSAITGDLYIVKYPPGTSVDKVKVHCDIFSTVYGAPDVIMIDYVGLLRPSVRSTSIHEEGKALAEELAALGELHDVPVIAAAQTVKGASSVNIRDLNEEHIGGSRGLQEVAFDTIMLSRPTDGIMTSKVQVKWVKNRSGGRVGVTSLYEVPNTFKLTDSVEEMFQLVEQSGETILPDEMKHLLGGDDNE